MVPLMNKLSLQLRNDEKPLVLWKGKDELLTTILWTCWDLGMDNTPKGCAWTAASGLVPNRQEKLDFLSVYYLQSDQLLCTAFNNRNVPWLMGSVRLIQKFIKRLIRTLAHGTESYPVWTPQRYAFRLAEINEPQIKSQQILPNTLDAKHRNPNVFF